jgi:hypothetical protein
MVLGALVFGVLIGSAGMWFLVKYKIVVIK